MRADIGALKCPFKPRAAVAASQWPVVEGQKRACAPQKYWRRWSCFRTRNRISLLSVWGSSGECHGLPSRLRLDCSSPRPSRPRWRSTGRRRSTTHPLGPKHSGGWRRRDFLGSRGMGAAGVPALAGWQAQGKKVSPPPLRQGDRGLPPCGPITPSRGRAGVCQTACQGEDVAGMGPCKRPGSKGEGTETLANRKAVPSIRDQDQHTPPRHQRPPPADSVQFDRRAAGGRVVDGQT